MASLQTRLLLTYLLVAGLVLGVVGASLLVFLWSSPIADRQTFQRLEVAGAALAEREARALAGQGAGRLRQMLGRLNLAETRLVIVGPDGTVVSDTQPGQAGMPSDLTALVRQGIQASGETEGGGSAYLFSFTPLDQGSGLLLVAPRPRTRLGTLLGEDLLRPFFRAGLVALGVSVVLAWMMARWVAAPMERLAEAARRVATGDFGAPTDVRGPAEVLGLATAFRDMVERVRAGQQAQRDFVANVSHELRTPLTSIQGFAQAIRDGAAGGREGVQRAGEVILEESERLKHLVEDLLDLARLDAGQIALERSPVDLARLVHGVMERLGPPALERRVRLTADLPPLPTIVGDGERLAQVFTNLVDNALRHSPSGAEVRVRGFPQGNWVAVTVEDSGPGIPAEELSRIFERFYQVDKARAGGPGRGTGLGLAISREIVEAHAGRLLAESTLGSGSRFSVQLPTALPDDATPVRRRPRL